MKEKAIFQAKSFYSAYINLERIFNECNDLFFYSPMIVNGAFSVELSIKALLINMDIPFSNEHNLVILFNLLPSNVQGQIWDWVVRKTPEYSDVEKREKMFILLSDTFRQWRYPYEGTVPAIELRFLSSLANATIGVLFSLGFNVDLVPRVKDKTDEEVEKMFEENREEIILKNMKYISKKK